MEKFGIKNHITIPGFAIVELGLSGNELICFSLIYGFCQDGESEFFGSLNYVTSALNIDRSNVIRILNKLTTKGIIIKRVETINNVKYCHYTISKVVVAKCNYQSQNNTTGSRKMQQGVVAKCDGGSRKTTPNNIIYNIKDNITDNIDTAEAEIVKDENDIRYERFTDWLKQNAPSILKLKDTFTKDQFLKLKRDFDNDTIMNICLAMQNYKELNKRYTSANLTFRQWAKRRQTNSTTNNNGKTSTRDQRIAGIDQYLADKYPSMVGNCKS